MEHSAVEQRDLERLREHVHYLAFDLDGTVTDSAGAIAANYQETFRIFHMPPPDASAVFPLIGLPLEDVLRTLIPDGADLPEAEIVAWRDCYREIYDDVALPLTTLFPGVRETLQRLVDLGFVCNLATSKRRSGAEAVLAYCGIRHFFTVVAGSDVAVEPKPHPAMLQWLMAELDCEPQHLLMTGDTTFDLNMGRSAGSFTCGVTYGVHTRAMLDVCRPDAVIDSFPQVLELLRQE